MRSRSAQTGCLPARAREGDGRAQFEHLADFGQFQREIAGETLQHPVAVRRFSISPKREKRIRNSRTLVVPTPISRASSSFVDLHAGLDAPRKQPAHEAALDDLGSVSVSSVGKKIVRPRLAQHHLAALVPGDQPRLLPSCVRMARTVVRLTPSVRPSSGSDGRSVAGLEQMQASVVGLLEDDVWSWTSGLPASPVPRRNAKKRLTQICFFTIKDNNLMPAESTASGVSESF